MLICTAVLPDIVKVFSFDGIAILPCCSAAHKIARIIRIIAVELKLCRSDVPLMVIACRSRYTCGS